MTLRIHLYLPILACMLCALHLDAQPPTHEFLTKVVEQAKKNDRLSAQYGFYQDTTIRKLSDDGKLKKIEVRTYRTVWIDNRPYSELIRIDGKELSSKQKSDEAKRRKDFLKTLRDRNKDDDEEQITWDDLYEKYDFDMSSSPDQQGNYAITFQPKKGKLRERSRTEKILNHITGRLWVDRDYNIVRVTARLMDDVSFGLGLFAKVGQLEMDYTQQPYEKVWLPQNTHIKFKARVALLKNEHREINMRLYDVFPRPEASVASKSSPE